MSSFRLNHFPFLVQLSVYWFWTPTLPLTTVYKCLWLNCFLPKKEQNIDEKLSRQGAHSAPSADGDKRTAHRHKKSASRGGWEGKTCVDTQSFV